MKIRRLKISYEEILSTLPLKCQDIRIGGNGFYRILKYDRLHTKEEQHDKEIISSVTLLGKPIFKLQSNGQFNDKWNGFNIECDLLCFFTK